MPEPDYVLGQNSPGHHDQLAPIEVRAASLRQTPQSGFSTILSQGIWNVSRVMHKAAAGAGYVPGAAVLGAAVNGAADLRDMTADMASGVGASPVLAQSPTQGTSILDHVKQRAAQGDQQAEMLVAMQQMQEMNQNFNTQYIIIQQQTQQETREFTALSNVMKLRHDNTRNILANLK